MQPIDPVPAKHGAAQRGLCWATVWLVIALVGVKAHYLGVPRPLTWGDGQHYVRSLAAISYADVAFAAVMWALGLAALGVTRRRRSAGLVVSLAFISVSALACVYAVANMVAFGIFGGFLTYPLVALVGNVRMVTSSVTALLTPRVMLALLGLPLAYIALVGLTLSLVRPKQVRWHVRTLALASLALWVLLGHHALATSAVDSQERRVAENPPWVFLSSWWRAVSGNGTVRLADEFAAGDLADFDPIGPRPSSAPGVIRRGLARALNARAPAAGRPPNVVLVVLESVAARWTSLNGDFYDTTPNLKAESARAVVFDSFYAHVGRSSNALAAMLLSAYPKLGFRDITEEYPDMPGTPLGAVFRDRGYRTAFITPSDLGWAGWDSFLRARGFETVRDYHSLSCSEPLSSWGVEDRCMVDAMLEFIDREPARPFFLMGWTTQTHHPYEPTPGVPVLDLLREPGPDPWDLGRYLNVLRETDRHLGRLFETIRRAGLDRDTLVVVVGDHGQGFGYPHDTYGHGRTLYEEDVRVPLQIWSPRLFPSARRSKTIGSLVDLAPTIADLAGVPPASDWQGRSLFNVGRPPRAYFYVAEDRFMLGVREANWKYVFDLRGGVEELYDLERDPAEQRNLASDEPDRSTRLRQRLAAWMEANRRQYEPVSTLGN